MKVLLFLVLISLSICNNVEKIVKEDEVPLKGYALLAHKKLVLSGLINSVQLQQTQRTDEQMRLSTNTLTLKSRLSNIQASQANELAKLYEQLSSSSNAYERAKIENKIKENEKYFKNEIDKMNQEILSTSIKENAIEMEVKRLDTKLTALKKQLEAIEKARSEDIENAIPKFNGLK